MQHRPVVVRNVHGVAVVPVDDGVVGLEPRVDFFRVHINEAVAVWTHVLVKEANRVADLVYRQAELREVHAFSMDALILNEMARLALLFSTGKMHNGESNKITGYYASYSVMEIYRHFIFKLQKCV